MDNNTAQIIGIIETSIMPDPLKKVYIERLTTNGANKELVEEIKAQLRSIMAEEAKKAGFEPANDDPKVIKLVADYKTATTDLDNRYTATMQDLEDRIEKVMNDTSAQLDKIETQIVKEELAT